MSIPKSFSVDIVGKEVLKLEAVVEMLTVVNGPNWWPLSNHEYEDR